MPDARRPIIRRATPADVPGISDIYNEAIRTTVATFDTEEKTVEDRERWLRAHDDRHPVLVALVGDRMAGDRVVGWASLTEWSDRCAYADTVEVSCYVHSEFRDQGIGRQLLAAIIDEARRAKHHTVLGRAAEGSDASLHLCQEAGFVVIGTLKEVGRKFGRLLDVHMLQLMLD
jgi:L-amino acid N-acyltransferase